MEETWAVFRQGRRRKEIPVSPILSVHPLSIQLQNGDFLYVEVNSLGEIIREVYLRFSLLRNLFGSRKIVSVSPSFIHPKRSYRFPYIAYSRYQRIIGQDYRNYGPLPGIRFLFDREGIYYQIKDRIVNQEGQIASCNCTAIELSYSPEMKAPVVVWQTEAGKGRFYVYDGKTGVQYLKVDFPGNPFWKIGSGYVPILKVEPSWPFRRAIEGRTDELEEKILYSNPHFVTVTVEKFTKLNLARFGPSLPGQAPGIYIVTLEGEKYFLPS